jgi:hypothetical protein
MIASGARSLQPYASCPRFTQTAEKARAKVFSFLNFLTAVGEEIYPDHQKGVKDGNGGNCRD